MRIDFDYFNKILSVFLAAETAHITLKDLELAGVNYLSDDSGVDEKFLHHYQLLIDNELIGHRDRQWEDLAGMGFDFGLCGDCQIKAGVPIRLTQQGHDFAKSLNNQEVLEKLKNEFKDAPFDFVVDSGKKLLTHILQKKLDGLLEE